MREKIEDKLARALGWMWITTFTIASVTALVAITKLFLSLIGVM